MPKIAALRDEIARRLPEEPPSGLREPDWAALVRYIRDRASMNEIAADMGVSKERVWQRVRRAVQYLRAKGVLDRA